MSGRQGLRALAGLTAAAWTTRNRWQHQGDEGPDLTGASWGFSRGLRGFQPCACEVRLWGPGGTRGRSQEELLAAEAAVSKRAAWLTPADEIEDFIRRGPLYERLLLTCPAPATAEWMDKAQALCEQLRVGSIVPNDMAEEMSKRIYHLYLPLYFWMRHQTGELRSARSSGGGAVLFGISAPQGFGKTTTMQLLQALFEADGLKFQAVSIDDFYLPATWQEEVANVYSDNALMQSRGNAGTHDVRLGTETLQALKKPEEDEVLVPRFDKSALNGRGDQVPKHSWTPVRTPCDVVVLEGWMVGFQATDGQAVANINQDLKLVNEKLKKYQAWNDLIDCFCVFAMDEIDQVYVWRSQAEEAMKRSGRDGMNQEEVKKFVDRYMPAYLAYRPKLYAAAAQGGVDGKPTWLCNVGRDRLPIYQ